MLDVMRGADDEDDDDDDESSSVSTIKRAPNQSQVVYENLLDTNNNTLTRTKELDFSQSIGIPNVPRVPMGAGFTKIFNQCPLEIHASTSWINHDSKGRRRIRWN